MLPKLRFWGRASQGPARYFNTSGQRKQEDQKLLRFLPGPFTFPECCRADLESRLSQRHTRSRPHFLKLLQHPKSSSVIPGLPVIVLSPASPHRAFRRRERGHPLSSELSPSASEHKGCAQLFRSPQSPACPQSWSRPWGAEAAGAQLHHLCPNTLCSGQMPRLAV